MSFASKAANAGQKAVTLSLFGITCFGGYVFFDAARDIIGRRYATPPPSPASATPAQTNPMPAEQGGKN